MIIGIGTDIVNINRIAALMDKHEDRFLARIFGGNERRAAQKHKHDRAAYVCFFAKRFAAKEAAVKALGTGFRGGIYPRDITVENDAHGKPCLNFTNGAHKALMGITPKDTYIAPHLSLSDDAPFALGYVILEARAGIEPAYEDLQSST